MTTTDYDAAIGGKRPSFIERLHAYWAARRLAQAARKQKRLQRMALSQLDAHLLRDIGIDPADIRDALDGRSLPVLFYPIRRRDHQ